MWCVVSVTKLSVTEDHMFVPIYVLFLRFSCPSLLKLNNPKYGDLTTNPWNFFFHFSHFQTNAQRFLMFLRRSLPFIRCNVTYTVPNLPSVYENDFLIFFNSA